MAETIGPTLNMVMRLDSVFSSIDSSLLGSAAGEGEKEGEREGEEGASLKKSPTDFHHVLNEQKIMKSITSSCGNY